jgi:hypothetical protein
LNINNNEQETLEQFLAMSQQMLEFAKNDKWEKLPDLEIKRKELMFSFFETEDSHQNTAQVAQIIKQVLSINDTIEQLAQQEKTIISQQLNGLKKQQNVHSAYLQNK